MGSLRFFYLVPQGVDIEEVEPGTSLLVRPDFWPYVLGVMLFIAGAMYLVTSRWHSSTIDKTESHDTSPNKNRVWQICAAFILMALFGLGSEAAGLVLPAIAIFLVSSLAFGRDLLHAKIIGSISVPLLLMLFFEYVANIPIPIGILEKFVN